MEKGVAGPVEGPLSQVHLGQILTEVQVSKEKMANSSGERNVLRTQSKGDGAGSGTVPPCASEPESSPLSHLENTPPETSFGKPRETTMFFLRDVFLLCHGIFKSVQTLEKKFDAPGAKL